MLINLLPKVILFGVVILLAICGMVIGYKEGFKAGFEDCLEARRWTGGEDE